MTEPIATEEITVEDDANGVPTMTTVERAQLLLDQEAAITARIQEGATLDEAVDPSNKEFGPQAHPEQVQMRVAKRAMMLKEGSTDAPMRLRCARQSHIHRNQL